MYLLLDHLMFMARHALKDYRIIPNITRSLILGDQLKIYNTGKQTRTYCYISDAMSGFF